MIQSYSTASSLVTAAMLEFHILNLFRHLLILFKLKHFNEFSRGNETLEMNANVLQNIYVISVEIGRHHGHHC